jgi:RNA polymerase sigma-70 factor, ECF subfamily
MSEQQHTPGGAESSEGLFSLVYDELYGLAKRSMNGQSPGHTLQPTALVNEAYLKVLKSGNSQWSNREHFLNFAAKAMRHVLVDHARKKDAVKRRSSGERVALDQVVQEFEKRSGNLLALDAGLEALANRDPQLVTIVELHFFGGCSFEETASALGMKTKEVKSGWVFARSWLNNHLKSELGHKIHPNP